MGFNRQKMELARKAEAEKEARARRALDPQILEDAQRLVAEWNARQERRMPMLFSPTIDAVLTAKHWFLHVRCPACRTTSCVDLRKLDWHPNAAVTALIPKLSCRGCRPNAPFAELLKLSQTSIGDELSAAHTRAVLGK
jgi:hypothetical protein